MKEPKILFWDIESTNLNATFGTILCIGYKWKGQKDATILSILNRHSKNMLDDKKVVEDFVKVFNEADYHVTWYGEGFDLPMLRSKIIKYGMPPIAAKPHLDLYKTAKRLFKTHSNRLAVWQDYLGVKHSKTPINFDTWLRAAAGDKRCLQEVDHHCKQDVFVLEEVFDKFRPWLSNEPNRQLFSNGKVETDYSCPSCGSSHYQKRGSRVTKTRRYQTYQCQDCGKWWNNRTPSLTINISTVES